MIHRRTIGKHWSLNETQNDTSTAHNTFRLMIGSRSSLESNRVPVSYTHQFPLVPVYAEPEYLFSDIFTFISNWTKTYTYAYSSINDQLPSNMHLVGLKSLGSDSLYTIMRFVHLYENEQSPIFSTPGSINLGTLFAAPLSIKDFYESTLTATQETAPGKERKISFDPIELRTFVAQLA
eukprot:Phypoly_transcript_20273.p1 GENE.Phypoly_transcript_20273~~Phypoly_transcript_20273.p1  ORF type:complete len:179 (+),score=8.17 Phypoly_transcript_20273:3-539(+)